MSAARELPSGKLVKDSVSRNRSTLKSSRASISGKKSLRKSRKNSRRNSLKFWSCLIVSFFLEEQDEKSVCEPPSASAVFYRIPWTSEVETEPSVFKARIRNRARDDHSVQVAVKLLDRFNRPHSGRGFLRVLHAHALPSPARHTFSREAPTSPTSRILGHSQITTTAQYVKVFIGDLKKVVEKKHPCEKAVSKEEVIS